ncbi:myc box-dependent-interacting protein 1-like [Actinia tenebrosa]|uniref:Myc box-dependent-interacting protein 1-like n=1 Tax=Actinia tenebrosa TaxID=6105 RepID=A0A6P8IHH7_ACTTE|nr:myc box-dependent-interacting protein 1-like [Actinia tenebrosa]XP_031566242.1 myc box-dependent-interacting protein 1-like [Actinia tenebrosa]
MADRGEKTSEKGFLARTASITSKRAKRAGEKVKQKLGKANETKDVTFDEFVTNFNKQQAAAQRLQKDFKNYNACIKAMIAASLEFGEAIKEVYEPDWASRDVVFKLLDMLHMHWTELQEKLQDEVLGPLTAYQSQFPDIKARINKHGRKLVDYDRLRHNFEALNSRGRNADQKKLTQSQEEFSEAKSVYTKLHAELYEELPALYDSRIAFYVSSFQSIFNAEALFHREAAKIKTQMNDLLDGLVVEASSGTHTTRRPFQLSSANPVSDSDDAEQLSNSGQLEPNQENVVTSNENQMKQEESEVDNDDQNQTNAEADNETPNPIHQPDADNSPAKDHEENDQEAKQPSPTMPVPYVKGEGKHEPVASPSPTPPSAISTSIQESTSPQAPDEPPAGLDIPFLYRVRATHKYVAEDDDELSFEKGEIIYVLEFDDPDEQDEGWLLGIMETSGLKGVFPANFTQIIKT